MAHQDKCVFVNITSESNDNYIPTIYDSPERRAIPITCPPTPKKMNKIKIDYNNIFTNIHNDFTNDM